MLALCSCKNCEFRCRNWIRLIRTTDTIEIERDDFRPASRLKCRGGSEPLAKQPVKYELYVAFAEPIASDYFGHSGTG